VQGPAAPPRPSRRPYVSSRAPLSEEVRKRRERSPDVVRRAVMLEKWSASASERGGRRAGEELNLSSDRTVSARHTGLLWTSGCAILPGMLVRPPWSQWCLAWTVSVYACTQAHTHVSCVRHADLTTPPPLKRASRERGYTRRLRLRIRGEDRVPTRACVCGVSSGGASAGTRGGGAVSPAKYSSTAA
jgi:hypothetical protein